MRVALFDVSLIFRMNWHATEHAEVGEAYKRTVDYVTRKASGFDRVYVCLDTPPYKRSELFEDYKAQREKPSSVMVDQAKQTIHELGKYYPIARCKGQESDDVIATLAAKHANDDVTVFSADKDLLQLVDDHVTVVSTSNGTEYWTQDVVQKFGIEPGQIVDFLAVVGDKSDNIPGAPGFGAVRAAALLKKWGTLSEALAHMCDEDSPLTPKQQATLGESAEQLRLNQTLVRLRNDLELEIKEPKVEDIQDAEVEEELPGMDEPAEASPQQNGGGTTQAITTVQAAPGKWENGLEPGNVHEAFRLAKVMHESRLYTKFPNAQAIAAVVIRGRELGLGALTALDNFHVIEGKPSMAASMMVALAKQHPECEYFVHIETTDKRSVWECKRRSAPKPERLEYSIEDAQKAGLLEVKEGKKPGPWHTRPKEMLRKTCAAQLAKVVFPEVGSGIYTQEELESA